MSDPPAEERPAPLIYGNKANSDVTVFVENQDFVVHRMVLASRSDYFQALFYGDFKEAKENRVEIKGVSVDIFKRIVDIFYSGRMTGYEAMRHKKETENGNVRHVDANDLVDIEDSLEKFWDFVSELLAAADLFNATDLVLRDLQEEVVKSKCNMGRCCFCINLYMFAFENKMPILNHFQKFNQYDYEEWSDFVFDESYPVRKPMRNLEPRELVILIKKFK